MGLGRKKKLFGTKRDGFVNPRIEAGLTEKLNALSFLTEKSPADLVQVAIGMLCDKHKEEIDLITQALVKAKQRTASETVQEGVQNEQGH
jgi:hypothetical protein